MILTPHIHLITCKTTRSPLPDSGRWPGTQRRLLSAGSEGASATAGRTSARRGLSDWLSAPPAQSTPPSTSLSLGHFPPNGEGRISTLIVLATLVILTACDTSQPDSSADEEPAEPTVVTHDYTDFDTDDLSNLTTPRAHHTVDLVVGDTQRFDSCHTIFEPDGEPTAWPVDDADIPHTLFGCNVEGYLELSEDRRAIAYEVPNEEHDDVTDLRMTVYDDTGDVAWTHRIRRHRYADNFAASYRGSFFTAVGDQLLCAGSRWLETTQIACARQGSGSVELDRHLKTRLALTPFAAHNSLFAADTRGITRRYPFTGAEMRHRSFPERAGRAGFYATDKEYIFVTPDDGNPLLTAWTLEDPERPRPAWHAELPHHPRPGFSAADADHELLLFRFENTLFGLDTTDGQIRMTFRVGDTNPHVVFSDDTLYLLLRPHGEDPALYAIDPTDGVVHWAAEAPPGTLSIDYRHGRLLTRTVRTVREVDVLE